MKKFKFCVCGLCIAIAAGLFAKANLVTPIQKEALLISNVEALSESFEWGGTWWNDYETHSWGENWKPVPEKCTVTEIAPVDSPFYPSSYTYSGYNVNCKTGNGNCLVGTFRCYKS